LDAEALKTRVRQQQAIRDVDGGRSRPDATEESTDGVVTPTRRRFSRGPPASTPDGRRSDSASPFRLPMPFLSPGQLALSTLQFLPVPILVVNNLKTVVLANDAFGRLVGPSGDGPTDRPGNASSALDKLRGQSLSQVGIDLLQDGRPVWVSWEAFLDAVVTDADAAKAMVRRGSALHDGHATPTASAAQDRASRPPADESSDVTVEVVISRRDINKTNIDPRLKSKASDFQAYAKMIVSVWQVEDRQKYFTLTFTSTEAHESSLARGRKSVAQAGLLDSADRKTIVPSNPPSAVSSRGSGSPSYRASPGTISVTSSPFPPMGPPSKSSLSNTPSILQKTIIMKDALLDNSEMPIIGMWKDGSVTFPNAAARKFLPEGAEVDDIVNGFDLLPKWRTYTEDFARELGPSEFPMAVLLRTEQPFSGMRFGTYDRAGKPYVLDALGEAIRDDGTGEFLAGVVTCRDVTHMTRMITEIKDKDAERFRLICDTMPQFVWTTTPDGMHDFFNNRWYSYTGLTEEESMGLGWRTPFHEEDLPEAAKRWKHSLETGDEYVAEYRCRSKDGEWRWFLGRALPLRDKETGKIEKWFGGFRPADSAASLWARS
jgi:PAS domain S-box-containing protein